MSRQLPNQVLKEIGQFKIDRRTLLQRILERTGAPSPTFTKKEEENEEPSRSPNVEPIEHHPSHVPPAEVIKPWSRPTRQQLSDTAPEIPAPTRRSIAPPVVWRTSQGPGLLHKPEPEPEPEPEEEEAEPEPPLPPINLIKPFSFRPPNPVEQNIPIRRPPAEPPATNPFKIRQQNPSLLVDKRPTKGIPRAPFKPRPTRTGKYHPVDTFFYLLRRSGVTIHVGAQYRTKDIFDYVLPPNTTLTDDIPTDVVVGIRDAVHYLRTKHKTRALKGIIPEIKRMDMLTKATDEVVSHIIKKGWMRDVGFKGNMLAEIIMGFMDLDMVDEWSVKRYYEKLEGEEGKGEVVKRGSMGRYNTEWKPVDTRRE